MYGTKVMKRMTMMANFSFEDYQKETQVAVQPHESEKDAVTHWTIGLTEEAGEVASLIKHRYYNNDRVSDEKIAEELGDVLWYVASICNELDINLATVAQLNVGKLQYRYQGEYTDGAVQQRHNKMKKNKATDEYKSLVTKLRR